MSRAVFDVARFHAEDDARHPDDRVRFFGAVADHVEPSRALYPGCYVDIAPSVHFDDVIYVDVDRRAARFFAEEPDVVALVETKRRAFRNDEGPTPRIAFHHLDYTGELPIDDASVDLLVSMYAGFISEHCTRYLKPGGHLLVNPSHGDASMASINPDYRLVAVVTRRDDRYTVRSDELDRCLVPKRGSPPTVEELHELGRGIAYTRTPFAYLFRLRSAG